MHSINSSGGLTKPVAQQGFESMSIVQETNRQKRFRAPRVTVVIPCYNHGSYIFEAIESVLAQTFEDIEIVVVNDGSTDPDTLAAFSILENKGFCVIHTANQGPAHARNAGIAVSRGEYILPLDADDMISKDFIRKAVNLMDAEPELGVVHSMVRFFGAADGLWRKPAFTLGRLLIENMIVATAMFRKDDWRAVGGYSVAMKEGWEDWDFWLSLAAIPRQVSRLDDEFFYYRIRHGSRTRSLSLRVKMRLFMGLIVNHKALYVYNIISLLASIPAWLYDGRGRRG